MNEYRVVSTEGFSMGDVVNLNRARKRTAKEQASKQADENRARFGRTKSERTQDRQLADDATKRLDQHRIDPEDRT